MLNPRKNDIVIAIWDYYGCFVGGFGYTLYSPYTLFSWHDWGPTLGSELLRIRGDCVVVSRLIQVVIVSQFYKA